MELNSFKRLCIELTVLLLAIIVIRGVFAGYGQKLTAVSADMTEAGTTALFSDSGEWSRDFSDAVHEMLGRLSNSGGVIENDTKLSAAEKTALAADGKIRNTDETEPEKNQKNDVTKSDKVQEIGPAGADGLWEDGGNNQTEMLSGDNIAKDGEAASEEKLPDIGYAVTSFTEHEKEPVAVLIEKKLERRLNYYNYSLYSQLIAEAKALGGAEAIPTTCFVPVENNDERYRYITGAGMKAYKTDDMPSQFRSAAVAETKMVTFFVPVWKMDSKGNKYASNYSITVNSAVAESVKCIFTEIYELDIQFPVNQLLGFSYRKVGGSGLKNSRLMSIHSFGVAIDINNGDYDNDYYLGKGSDLRNKENPYCIPEEVIEIFARYGWNWGGNFDICSDTMHFQYFGLEFLQYEHEEPFPVLYYGAKDMRPEYVRNLTDRLVRLEYLDKPSTKFSEKVKDAVMCFQQDMGLEQDGTVDYETWVPLINLTHDMSYVF